MGLFEFTSAAFDSVTDAAAKVRQAGQVIEKVAERAGLGKLVSFGKALEKYTGPLAIAPTPVLQGGQKAIDAMRSVTGDGENGTESGDAFARGSHDFHEQAELHRKLRPDSTWEGGPAPAAYDRRVTEQEGRLSILRDADSEVASIITRELEQLNETRRILDNLHNWLAEYGEYTQTLGVIPVVGKNIQYNAEILAVGMALKEATSKMRQMHDDANANAEGVRHVLASYEGVTRGAVQQDSVGDFDPPR
jgi:EspA/EspE family